MAIRRASAPQQAVEVAERDAPRAAAAEPDVLLPEGAEVVARSDGPPQEVVAEVAQQGAPRQEEEEPDVPLQEGAEVVARDAPRAAAEPDAPQVAAGHDAPQVAEPDVPPVAAVARSDGPPQEVVAEVAQPGGPRQEAVQPGAPRQAETVLELTSVADRAG